MISLDFLQFYQTNLLFFIASALGLIRERKVLPFVIVLMGNLIHGGLAAALLAALILWHRVDFPTSKWIQLKDAIALFFIFVAAVAPEPFQEFAICFGVLVMSVSFGCGELGVIPAILLLRQFVPHPADVEILLGVGAVYWVFSETLRFLKTGSETIIRSVFEVICSLGVLFGLKDVFLKWSDDPVLISVGSGLVVLMLAVAGVVKWKNDWFWTFYRKSKIRVGSAITLGDRMISSKQLWNDEQNDDHFLSIQSVFDRIFILATLTAALIGVFFVIAHGGFG